jgi:cation-transporting P-type ATPase E
VAITTYTGLTAAEVAERTARGEINNFQARVSRTYWQIVRDNVFNVFNIVLIVLLVFMFFYRDFFSILFAGFSVTLNSALGVWQEINAKRALDKLAALSVQEVKVWRDGKLTQVPYLNIVKDDVLPIEPGDRIVVDGHLLNADSMEVDESQLTGESDPILKEKDDDLQSGSFCIAGSGVMLATRVGADSTINRLSATAKTYRQPLTPTQKELNRLIQLSLLGMLLFFPMTVIRALVNNLEIPELLRNAVVLVTSFVPQGLVLATTVSLSIGALRITRKQTLVQRINSVESIANVNVLCFDKTGTLTRNQLSVTDLLPLNGMNSTELCTTLKRYVCNLSTQNKTAAAIAKYVENEPDVPITKRSEIPFNSARKWGALVFDAETIILGAPERVLDKSKNADAIERAKVLAEEGNRVLAFARSVDAPKDNALSPEREAVALIVMCDNVRDDIQETLAAFSAQDVTLKVISGDNAETVAAIAKQAGMQVANVYTGDQLERMSGGDFESAVVDGTVFARIEPDTKKKIIGALKRRGLYVAMVGDGVNDVPALKEANLAIAMNDGAQIAKDVADLVLLNNAMSTLPLAFEHGKVITQKIFGSTKLFLVKNFYTILAFIFVGYMTLPFPTNPIQISWLTFGVVNIPGILITFGLIRTEKVRDFGRDVMGFVLTAVVVGAVAFAGLYTLLYEIMLTRGDEVIARETARSGMLMFMTLYGTVIFWHVMGMDILRPTTMLARPRMVLLGILQAVITIGAAYALPRIMSFSAPSAEFWAIIIGFAVASTVALHFTLRHEAITRVMKTD